MPLKRSERRDEEEELFRDEDEDEDQDEEDDEDIVSLMRLPIALCFNFFLATCEKKIQPFHR